MSSPKHPDAFINALEADAECAVNELSAWAYYRAVTWSRVSVASGKLPPEIRWRATKCREKMKCR
jgi:hypothetical protein